MIILKDKKINDLFNVLRKLGVRDDEPIVIFDREVPGLGNSRIIVARDKNIDVFMAEFEVLETGENKTCTFPTNQEATNWLKEQESEALVKK